MRQNVSFPTVAVGTATRLVESEGGFVLYLPGEVEQLTTGSSRSLCSPKRVEARLSTKRQMAN